GAAMNLTYESRIRQRAAHLALAVREEAEGPFEGRSVDDYAAMIVAAHIAADESRLSLHRWVDAGRRAGMSWSDIGALIGVSKQGAQQRFGGAGDDGPPTGEGLISVRLGATAFNEVGMLREEGLKGRELIGTGALALTFRQTDRMWEHVRTTGIGPDVAGMKAEGWTYVSSWFVFHYFKRAVS
ncbi:MAG TPA: hypothetical protein VF652_06690, partial [Allosphingosinicella sp.]